MSTSLKWCPSGKGRSLRRYDFTLKNALREEYGGASPCTLTRESLPFLRGLKAAKVDGADELIELIDQHDAIDLWEES